MAENPYLEFDGMVWPNPWDPAQIEYALRYGKPTRTDLIVAASFMAAYRQLVEIPAKTRAERVKQLREADPRG